MSDSRHDEQAAPESSAHPLAPEPRALSPRKTLLTILVLLVVAAVLAVVGILPRVRARSTLANQTDALAAPDVQVVKPQLGKPTAELELPGNVYAYIDSPIYARTDGYLEKWYYDIGAHVRKGQLLAVISSPEVDKQLLQARADLLTAEATAGLAKTNASRYKDLLTQNAVSQQDTDSFVTQQASTTSAVKSAQANMQRLEELQSFEKIYAPFDGVITKRNIDVGQLINSGAGMEMFHIDAIDTLRVYVNVPQVYSRGAVPGAPAEVSFSEFPGQTFPGKVVRTADAIDQASRTLLVEVDVKNRKGLLLAGSYAQVHMNLNTSIPQLEIPVSALIFRNNGLQVGTVVHGAKGDVGKLNSVTLGQDDGKTVQVLTGLDANVEVISDPPDSLIDNEPLHVIPETNQQSDNSSSENSKE